MESAMADHSVTGTDHVREDLAIAAREVVPALRAARRTRTLDSNAPGDRIRATDLDGDDATALPVPDRPPQRVMLGHLVAPLPGVGFEDLGHDGGQLDLDLLHHAVGEDEPVALAVGPAAHGGGAAGAGPAGLLQEQVAGHLLGLRD